MGMDVDLGIQRGNAPWLRAGAWLLVVLLLALPAAGQGPDPASEPLTIKSVQQMRDRAAADKNLTEALRDQVLETYDRAIASLRKETDLKAVARRNVRDRRTVTREIRRLQAELDRPTPEPAINLPADASAERIERQLTQERAELAARRQMLHDLDQLSETRANRRNEISQRIGSLNQHLEVLGDELRSVSQQDAAPELNAATMVQVRAEIQAVTQEIATLRSEQSMLDMRADLLPLRRDKAGRRVAESERLVSLLAARALASKRAEAEAALARVRKSCAEAIDKYPDLGALAEETRTLADKLWNQDGGVVVELEDTTQEVTLIKRFVSEMRRIATMTRRKFEAVRTHGIAAQWWPTLPEDLPSSGDLKDLIRRREKLLPNVQHEIIVLNERRIAEGNLEREVQRYVREIQESDPDADAADIERTARKLVATRRELLDALIRNYNRYSDQLFELTAASRELLSVVTTLDNYIMERVLWVRSVPGPKIPPLVDVAGGLRWIFLNPEWGAILPALPGQVFRDAWAAVLLLSLGLLLGLRRRLRRYLERERPGKPGFRTTLWALLVTLALAAPAPLVLLLLSHLFAGSGQTEWIGPLKSGHRLAQSELARAVAAACYWAAGFLGAFALMIELLRRRGLGEAYCGWNPAVTGPARRIMRRYVAALTPLLMIMLALAEVGLRFHSAPNLRAYSNGLGRICFIAVTLLLAAMAAHILRPDGPIMRAAFPPGAQIWAAKLRYVWFPLLMALLVLPAVLASQGYFVTAFTIFTGLVKTFWLSILAMLAEELLMQWRSQHPATAGHASESVTSITETGAHAAVLDLEAQVRQITRFSLSFVWLLGFLIVWQPVVPSLQVFKQVEIWPEVKFLAARPGAEQQAKSPSEAAPQPPTEKKQAPSSGAAATIKAVSPVAGAVPESRTQSEASHLTLYGLLGAMFIFGFTIVLAKNMPGLLEFTLLRRMPLQAGVRTTVTTLVRYFVVIVGVSVGAGVVGFGWQKIQWLAAALTFGLGFGLQEIFANFVSGLIILFDRPIRVGDVVTVGDIGGWVTKISIRATTITKWDRSELIVPNKEFIIGQLTNWTLSNSLTRVEVKVGVEYGSDVEKVRNVLLDLAHNHPAVLRDPPPYVVLMEFGDSSINFELRVYLNYDYGRLTIRDELQRRIVAAFADHGIIIAFPQLDLHVKSAEPQNLPEQPPPPPPRATPPGLQDADD